MKIKKETIKPITDYVKARVLGANLEDDTITFQLPKGFWITHKIRAGYAFVSIGECIIRINTEKGES